MRKYKAKWRTEPLTAEALAAMAVGAVLEAREKDGGERREFVRWCDDPLQEWINIADFEMYTRHEMLGLLLLRYDSWRVIGHIAPRRKRKPAPEQPACECCNSTGPDVHYRDPEDVDLCDGCTTALREQPANMQSVIRTLDWVADGEALANALLMLEDMLSPQQRADVVAMLTAPSPLLEQPAADSNSESVIGADGNTYPWHADIVSGKVSIVGGLVLWNDSPDPDATYIATCPNADDKHIVIVSTKDGDQCWAALSELRPAPHDWQPGDTALVLDCESLFTGEKGTVTEMGNGQVYLRFTGTGVCYGWYAPSLLLYIPPAEQPDARAEIEAYLALLDGPAGSHNYWYSTAMHLRSMLRAALAAQAEPNYDAAYSYNDGAAAQRAAVLAAVQKAVRG